MADETDMNDQSNAPPGESVVPDVDNDARGDSGMRGGRGGFR